MCSCSEAQEKGSARIRVCPAIEGWKSSVIKLESVALNTMNEWIFNCPPLPGAFQGQWNKFNMLRIPSGCRGVEPETTRYKSSSGQSGTGTRDIQISSPASWPLSRCLLKSDTISRAILSAEQADQKQFPILPLLRTRRLTHALQHPHCSL